MNVAPCFTSEHEGDLGDFLTHLRPATLGPAETLCGRKAMPALKQRRKINCETCLARKPKVLGGR